MQPKGRALYIFDSVTNQWVPWEGTGAGFGGVTLFDQNGQVIQTPDGNSDSLATTRLLGTASFNYAFNGTTWSRVRIFANNADDIAVVATGLQAAAAYGFAFDGTTYDRLRTGSAANLSAAQTPPSLLVHQPGNWSITHTPTANTQATITRAAGGAGIRHVCTSITALLSAPAAATSGVVQINLRDGGTGAGTILWSATVQIGGASSVSGGAVGVSISGLNIFGTANTAMTLEFSAAGGANTSESVALTGHDVI